MTDVLRGRRSVVMLLGEAGLDTSRMIVDLDA